MPREGFANGEMRGCRSIGSRISVDACGHVPAAAQGRLEGVIYTRRGHSIQYNARDDSSPNLLELA